MDKGLSSVALLLNLLFFDWLPTILGLILSTSLSFVELLMVCIILLQQYRGWYAAILFATVVIYVIWTIIITEV
jgi:ABC-type transport system involved in Fe-S cluster assembly fused permease/ATPase subunit